MKKATLKLSSAELEEDRVLFSIITSESDLQVCMLLNSCLGIKLALDEDIEIKRKSRIIPFRKYVYENDELIEKYVLFSNFVEGEYLFPELKKIDYLLMVSTEAVISNIENRVYRLKTFPEISGIFKIEPKSIRSLNKLKI